MVPMVLQQEAPTLSVQDLIVKLVDPTPISLSTQGFIVTRDKAPAK